MPGTKDSSIAITTEQRTAAVKSEFNPTGKVETFTVSKSPRDKCWRLVHNGKTVLACLLSDGITETRFTLECFNDLDSLKKQVAALGLQDPEGLMEKAANR